MYVHAYKYINIYEYVCVYNVTLKSSGRGKGRGRVRLEDEEDLGNARPSAPSTLFDFLESKMGNLTVEGRLR